MTTGRLCGAGKNPLTTWLRGLGVWKKTGARKSVPDLIYTQPDDVVAAFLRGLYHADGSLSRFGDSTRLNVRLSTISEELARGVQHLLLRFGINAFSEGGRSQHRWFSQRHESDLDGIVHGTKLRRRASWTRLASWAINTNARSRSSCAGSTVTARITTGFRLK